MLKERLKWLSYADNLKIEIQQSKEEGKDISGYEGVIKSALEMPADHPAREKTAGEIFDMFTSAPPVKSYNYIEPSDLEGIRSERYANRDEFSSTLTDMRDEDLMDKIYGGWLGRCAGCLLGQPVEGWHRQRIIGLLRETGNYPIQYYISSELSQELREKFQISDEGGVYGNSRKAWINNVSFAPEDDDTNYTILGLKILEQYGPEFTSYDVAESWLNNLPVFHTCTAERVAYKNIVNGVLPPRSASFRNPYREWIGAQIRADFFGYITPGKPELGAEMAWRDASISHVKNGIYGEMFVAAMLSAAAVTKDVEEIVSCGLSQIPQKSRLAEALKQVLDWKRNGVMWEQALDKVHAMYNETNPHEWCHTVSNAMIVCIGLLYGEMDFEKSIGIAVMGALDTDCNGATVGSIVGMALGAQSLPQKWINPLNNQLKSGVDGLGLVKISDLAKRTLDIVKKIK